MGFISDLRQIKKPIIMIGGAASHTAKINEVFEAVDQILEAADRNADADGGNGLPTATFNGWICVDGESQYYTIAGQPATPPS